LQSLYRNTDLPEALRAKCAAASLPHEVPKIQSVPPAIDASCEEIIPLADLVTAQRKRADAMLREAREIRVLPNGQVLLLDEHEPSGNGNGGDEH
jgi:hypothetical protein